MLGPSARDRVVSAAVDALVRRSAVLVHGLAGAGAGEIADRVVAPTERLFTNGEPDRLASAVARRLSRRLGPRGFDRLPGPLAGWTKYRHFPPMAAETFTARHRQRSRAPQDGALRRGDRA